MNKLIDLAARVSGLGWIWDRLDGWKTYLAAAAGILSGLAGLIGEIIPVINHKSFSEALNLVKHLPQDPSWMLVVGGLGALGIGHGMKKMDQDGAALVGGYGEEGGKGSGAAPGVTTPPTPKP